MIGGITYEWWIAMLIALAVALIAAIWTYDKVREVGCQRQIVPALIW